MIGSSDIVRKDLHRFVGWTANHQAAAEQIIHELKLKLPRDRELIRQLAVIYVAQDGKPKESQQ